ncbi:MAG: hypothetical protein FGM33_03150 [Candidatus Kapabacteria bacterium]|nr:hypothetical protein [Candidatus Kapabacteria bacterium]
MTPQDSSLATSHRMIHRIAVVLCVLTFGLIVWGGHVNTTRSGMAFPDWPTSNLAPMVTYSPSEWLWAKDRFWEHGHRLFATVVGIVTTLLLVISFRSTPKAQRPGRSLAAVIAGIFLIIASAVLGINNMPMSFMELFMIALGLLTVGLVVKAIKTDSSGRIVWLALAAFTAVCLQGSFGGYTVRHNLPDWTSTSHGVLAQLFLMIVLAIALQTSASWRERHSQAALSTSTTTLASVTWALTFMQFVLGALTRHTDSWGVSVTFPQWSDAGFFPSAEMLQYPQVVIHFIHRSLAYVVAIAIVLQFLRLRSEGAPSDVRRTSAISLALVGVQILLGAGILWTARGELVTTLHVMVGVVILVSNAMTMLSVRRQPLAVIDERVVRGLAHEGGR